MIEITQVKSDKYGIEVRLNNGTVLNAVPHPDRWTLTLSGVDVPTYINNDFGNHYNNTLNWYYEVRNDI